MGLSDNPFDWPAASFLLLYLCLLAGAVLATLAARAWLLAGPGQSGPPLGPVEIALLGGGTARAADTVVVGLLEAGVATLDAGRKRPLEIAPGKPFPPGLERFRGVASGTMSRKEFTQALAPALAPVRDSLVRRGLAPSDAQLARIAGATTAVFTALLMFGALRVVIGLQRERPVGFLVALLLLALVAAVVLVWREPSRTRAGRVALRECHARHSRAGRAPLPGELALAFALLGPIVLTGTPFAAYAQVISPPGGSDGGGCGSGGDGGGSGCGGCGGE